ncbi:ras association domain-containing protein 2-like isoform X2 [Gigantopelta aegis]|uniref:ras association domain-containing protein 2-like isoform X2 n=1 Tax=Gigantopelta aegis TaxID=1735272 RepID=UPI001B887C81|nr:ras association domain-containing protein 2-like isoform X2 [Gigantopelta aegis]
MGGTYTTAKAERKTSLGRDWHPNCLRCKECARVLTPSQHAERKGLPYCHNCYKTLFGPLILGYGSNLHSPANYKRSSQQVDRLSNSSDHDEDYTTEIFSFNSNREANSAIRTETQPNQKYHVMYKKVEPPDKSFHTEPPDKSFHTELPDKSFHTQPPDNGFQSEPPDKGFNPENPDKSQDKEIENENLHTPQEEEMLKKVEIYNAYYEGKIRNQITTDNQNGELVIRGPLRIYWGLFRPIQLKESDDVKPLPISNWRHSLYPTGSSPKTTVPSFSVTSNGFSPTKQQIQSGTLKAPSSPTFRGVDDSVLSQSVDGVVRRKHIKKFNTVAYRGDRPTKWKRASINGHIYNYDTSVFTPVLGSSTSVTVSSSMQTSQVITALLEKFKVQNQPEEYHLSIVSEKGERILSDSDYPLAERILNLGPDETEYKIFIKDRELEPQKDSPVTVAIPEVEEHENLPDEVETLLILPEAVLRGFLRKFQQDEENDVQTLKARYEMIKKKISSRLEEMQRNSATSTA